MELDMVNTDINKSATKLMIALCLVTISSAGVADVKKHKAREHTVNHSEIVYGKVVKVTPIYKEVKVSTPVKECWQEPVTQTQHVRHGSNSAGGTLAGGLIGGIIGHQFGKGRGKKLSTAMGTLIGAQLGHDAATGSHSSQQSYTRYESFCEVENQVSYEEVLDSYKVTYRYNGKKYKLNLPYDPGKRIKLRVNVTPVY
jgi:uncharacterized protein YcfJ